jgi:hypothetical protein
MKKIDFECQVYNDFYAYVVGLFGERCVNVQDCAIEINDGRVFLRCSFCYNETKIYFMSTPALLMKDQPYSTIKMVPAFRVFSLELAKQYVDFKKAESDLIRNIEG